MSVSEEHVHPWEGSSSLWTVFPNKVLKYERLMKYNGKTFGVDTADVAVVGSAGALL